MVVDGTTCDRKDTVYQKIHCIWNAFESSFVIDVRHFKENCHYFHPDYCSKTFGGTVPRIGLGKPYIAPSSLDCTEKP